MHKSATKCNEILGKWCKNKHGASKIMDTFEMYHHPSEAEEEDSPLQQSAQGMHPSMADSYPEDIMSKAEEEMAGMATEEAADKEVDGEAKEEEQNDGADAEEEEIP
jgi:hypothetical protein